MIRNFLLFKFYDYLGALMKDAGLDIEDLDSFSMDQTTSGSQLDLGFNTHINMNPTSIQSTQDSSQLPVFNQMNPMDVMQQDNQSSAASSRQQTSQQAIFGQQQIQISGQHNSGQIIGIGADGIISSSHPTQQQQQQAQIIGNQSVQIIGQQQPQSAGTPEQPAAARPTTQTHHHSPWQLAHNHDHAPTGQRHTATATHTHTHTHTRTRTHTYSCRANDRVRMTVCVCMSVHEHTTRVNHATNQVAPPRCERSTP